MSFCLRFDWFYRLSHNCEEVDDIIFFDAIEDGATRVYPYLTGAKKDITILEPAVVDAKH